MALLTKDNVMQARYLDAEQQNIMVLYIDFDADGKARANYEIIIEAGSAQHKELHSAGWDHARIDTITLEYNISNQREVEEKVLGHEATKIIDERLQATKDALAKAEAAYRETKKIRNDMLKEIEGLMSIAHLRKTEGTSVLIANFLFDNNTDEAAIEILKNKTGKTGNSLIEILTKCTKEGGGNTKY